MSYLRSKREFEKILLEYDDTYQSIMFSESGTVGGYNCPHSSDRKVMQIINDKYDGMISRGWLDNLDRCREDDDLYYIRRLQPFDSTISKYLESRFQDISGMCGYCHVYQIFQFLSDIHKANKEDQEEALRQWINSKNTTQEK